MFGYKLKKFHKSNADKVNMDSTISMTEYENGYHMWRKYKPIYRFGNTFLMEIVKTSDVYKI